MQTPATSIPPAASSSSSAWAAIWPAKVTEEDGRTFKVNRPANRLTKALRRLLGERSAVDRPSRRGRLVYSGGRLAGQWTVDYTRPIEPRPLILKRGETKSCDPISATAICASGHRKSITYACTSRKCVQKPCRRHALKERTRKLRPLMQEAFQGAWGIFVLTYCPELRPKLADQGLFRASRGAAAALIEQFLLEINGLGKGWRIGIVSVDHPQGDPCKTCKKTKDPFCAECRDRTTAWKPHHNFLIPLVAFGPGGARAKLRGLNPEKPSIMPVKLLRELWRYQQEILLGRELGRDADVWYGFRIGQQKKNHALKYFPRTFPAWPAKAQRLVYYAGFGAAVINDLKEVSAVREKFEAKDDPGLVCSVCGLAIIHIHVEAPVPSNWRAVDTGPP